MRPTGVLISLQCVVMVVGAFLLPPSAQSCLLLRATSGCLNLLQQGASSAACLATAVCLLLLGTSATASCLLWAGLERAPRGWRLTTPIVGLTTITYIT